MTRSKRVLGLGVAAILGLAAVAAAADTALTVRNLAPGGAVPAPAPAREAGLWDRLPARSEAVFDFPSDDSTVVGSVGFIDSEQVGYFWSVIRGDSVTEDFSGPRGITSYSLDVDVIENALNNGAFVNWDVLINGIVVDSFTVNEGFLGTLSRRAIFPPIAGPSYTVRLEVTNEVAGGEGSHTFRYAGVGLHQVDLGGGLALRVNGTCPGLVRIDLRGATPNGRVAIARSANPGSFIVPSGLCAGTELDLDSPQLLVILDADPTGGDSVQGMAPAGACGVFLQALDLTSCGVSNVNQVP